MVKINVRFASIGVSGTERQFVLPPYHRFAVWFVTCVRNDRHRSFSGSSPSGWPGFPCAIIFRWFVLSFAKATIALIVIRLVFTHCFHIVLRVSGWRKRRKKLSKIGKERNFIKLHLASYSQSTHDVRTTLLQRRFNFLTSLQRPYNVHTTSIQRRVPARLSCKITQMMLYLHIKCFAYQTQDRVRREIK